jgi:hypothetical protein
MAAGVSAFLLLGCRSSHLANEFAYDAPVKSIVFDLPFPTDLVYSATPDPKIIIGKKNVGSPDGPIYEIAGFEIVTGIEKWRLPFQGEVVGQTEKQILVYEEKTSTLHFIAPADGQVTRKITPAPNPLMSKNALEYGMAFNDEMYLTTKALYTSVWANAIDWEHRYEDDTFKIGITAKSWGDEKVKWFVPPVKQIVIIENRPVIFGDKVFILNPPESIDGDQTYQIVSLTTGEEIFRGKTAGKFSHVAPDVFIEQTDSMVRRFDPVTGAEIWKIEGSFHNAAVKQIGNQITIAAPHEDGTRMITLIDAPAGKSLAQFELIGTGNTPLKACFLTADKQTLCNFVANGNTDIQKRDFDYWVAYDPAAKKALWRTGFNSRPASSLFPFASDNVRFVDAK